MPKQIEKIVYEDIAAELGVKPSFIEKDYYAVHILNELSKIEYENAKLIFSGGTCLSKGYKLIKRFSEDLDFRIDTTVPFTRPQRREFREFIISKIKDLPDLEYLEESLDIKNNSELFGFNVKYPKLFTFSGGLRNDLKLEFTFKNLQLPTNTCPIETFVSKYTGKTEITKMNCISPVEIGADKLSALMWRVDIKNRTKPQGHVANDATIIRHLHDLSALEKLLLNDVFIKCAEKSFETDKGRSGSNDHIILAEYAKRTLDKLKTDSIYAKEYKEFVDALSYSKESETIDFKRALSSFERIVDFIKMDINKNHAIKKDNSRGMGM